jgi:hypothetical protein
VPNVKIPILFIATTVFLATGFLAYGDTIKYFDGNNEEMTLEDTNGNRYTEVTYNDRGLITAVHYFDEYGFPEHKTFDGFSACRIEWTYDSEGREKSAIAYEMGEETRDLVIAEETEYSYYNDGALKTETEKSYTDGKFRVTTKYEYDKKGNETAKSLFDEAGEPIFFGNDSYHRIEWTYDEFDRMTSESYFGLKSEPVSIKRCISHLRDVGRSWGGGPNCPDTHRIEYKRSDTGNVIEAAYFGIKDEPVADSKGIHRITGRYDRLGNQLEEAYFGVKGEPVSDGKTHRIEMDYDENGRVIAERKYDVDGEPNIFSGCDYYFENTFDEFGNVCVSRVFTFDREPTLNRMGVHREVSEFIGVNKDISTSYFGVNDEPVAVKGVHRTEKEYDPDGNLVSISFFGVTGEPVIGDYRPYRYHTMLFERDNHGRLTAEKYLGVSGEPIARSEEDEVHSVVFTYFTGTDLKGKPSKKITSEAAYGIDGSPVIKNYWRIFFRTLFGPRPIDGPMTVKNVHRIDASYDDWERLTSVEFYGTEGERVANRYGVQRYEYAYIDYDRPSSVTCINYDGGLISGYWPGYLKITSEYDGMVWKERALYGPNGEPISDENGIHKKVLTTDEDGKNEVKYFNAEGDPIAGDPHTRFPDWF